jgi:hypothetical protein
MSARAAPIFFKKSGRESFRRAGARQKNRPSDFGRFFFISSGRKGGAQASLNT